MYNQRADCKLALDTNAESPLKRKRVTEDAEGKIQRMLYNQRADCDLDSGEDFPMNNMGMIEDSEANGI
jgi:hypothetical protein